jgi:uncharacterized Zn finger protein
MMEALAQADGDLDGLVRVMAHDLSLPYGYLRIAEVLREAGRAEEALAWAERGLRTFPDRYDSRLSDLVADAYLRAGRHEEAMSLTWEDFVARPVVERYERLRDALEVYRRGVEPAVARANQGGYDEAVALLQRMRPIMHRLGREAAFGREVAQLRTARGRKRNLVRLLDGLDWPEVPPSGTP